MTELQNCWTLGELIAATGANRFAIWRITKKLGIEPAARVSRTPLYRVEDAERIREQVAIERDVAARRKGGAR